METQAIDFTDVTLRDGEQQPKKFENMPPEDRIEVFDSLVNAGIRRIEIGHLANEHDADFARHVVSHCAERVASGDERYGEVELQVLFGSQAHMIQDGIDAIDGFDKDRVIVHVYDRVSPELTGLAAEPYSAQESAERVKAAAKVALDGGFTRFSISGEGTVDPTLDIDDAVDYYIDIATYLYINGAETVNLNMADTFGASVIGEWGAEGLAYFNERVKLRAPGVETSVHVHNDYGSAADFAVASLRAGFDRVEGTMIGMGERTGNVALADVITRLLEDARTSMELQEKYKIRPTVSRFVVRESMWNYRHITERVRESLHEWYASCVSIGEIYETKDRFGRTSLGHPDAYNSGSGPHDHATLQAIKDPVEHPMYENYARVALIHAMMGRPEAEQVISVDPSLIKHITVGGHAHGGSTDKIQNDVVEWASEERRKEAVEIAHRKMERILETVGA